MDSLKQRGYSVTFGRLPLAIALLQHLFWFVQRVLIQSFYLHRDFYELLLQKSIFFFARSELVSQSGNFFHGM